MLSEVFSNIGHATDFCEASGPGTVEEETATIDNKNTSSFFLFLFSFFLSFADGASAGAVGPLSSQLQKQKLKHPGEDLGADSPLFSC